jgi:predicted metal-dependent hydrolase
MTYHVVIKRSTRRKRSIKLEVLADNTVEVVAPKRTPESAIHSLLDEKDAWIQKRLQFNMENADKLRPKRYVDGEPFYYLGSSYPLKLSETAPKGVGFYDGYLCINSRKSPDKALAEWYKSIAYDILEDRVEHFSRLMSLSPSGLRIKRMKTRWGSCSSAGNLNFNWVLVMAPLPVIDYVVIHELCHLVHMDHSKHFWDLVEQYCPDYKLHTKWLKEHGSFLTNGI